MENLKDKDKDDDDMPIEEVKFTRNPIDKRWEERVKELTATVPGTNQPTRLLDPKTKEQDSK